MSRSAGGSLRRVAGFELRERLRDAPFYLCTGLLFAYWFAATLRLEHDPNFWGSSGEVLYNAPLVLYFLISVQAFVSFLCVPAFMATPLLRDRELHTAEALSTLPVPSGAFFWGRFLGALAALALCTTAASTGVVLAPLAAAELGWVDPQRVSAPPLAHLAVAWICLLLPAVATAGGVVYALAALTRRHAAALVGTIALVLSAALAHYLGSATASEALQIIDLTGFHALHRATQYWTVAQRNTEFLPLTANLLLGRGFWLLGAAALLTLAAHRFARGGVLELDRSRPHLPVCPESPARAARSPTQAPAGAGSRRAGPGLLLGRARFELVALLREPLFALALALCLLWALAQNLAGVFLGGEPRLPDTAQMAQARRGLWMLALLALPFAAVTGLFRERTARLAEIVDATGAPNWVLWGSKLLALGAFAALLPLAVLLAGLGTQIALGFHAIDWPLYAHELGFSYYPYLLRIAAFAFAAASLVAARASAFALALLTLYLSVFAHEAGWIERGLWLQAYEVADPPSGFADPAARAARTLAYHVYWLALAGLALGAATRLWRRGEESGLRVRLRAARPRFTSAAATALGILAALATASALWIAQSEARWSAVPDPRIVGSPSGDADLDPRWLDVDLRVRLDPAARRAEAHTTVELQNPATAELHRLRLGLPREAELVSLSVSGEPIPSHRRERSGAQIHVQLRRPVPPATRFRVDAHLILERRGFGSAQGSTLHLSPAGVWLPDFALLPEPHREAADPPQLGVRTLQSATGPLSMRTSPPSTTWRVAIETPAEYLAVAPGRRVSEARTSNGTRRAIHRFQAAATRGPFPILAAPFDRAAGEWRSDLGPPVAIEVLSLPGDSANASRFLEEARSALDFLSHSLGPYPHSQVRIIQTPRTSDALATHPNLVLLPENEGWRTDLRRTDGHRLHYRLARQLASHWWSQGIDLGFAPGRGTLLRGVPEYLALRSVATAFGEEIVLREYVPRALHRYFWYHGIHGHEEPSLLESTGNEYVDETKAALALRAIGAHLNFSRLDDLIGGFLRAFSAAPGTATLADLHSRLQEAALPREHPLVNELLSEVIHYEARIESASLAPPSIDGYRLRLTVRANRIAMTPAGAARSALDAGHSFPVEFAIIRGESSPASQLIEHHTLFLRPGLQEVELPPTPFPPTAVQIDPRTLLLDPNPAPLTRIHATAIP